MIDERDGGPAFPSAQPESVFVEELGRYDDRLGPPQGGMSLRDYFAAKAMSGMCAIAPWPRLDDAVEMSKRAYVFADAMLEARKR